MWLPTRKLSAVAETPVWNRTIRKQSRAVSSISGEQSMMMPNNLKAENTYQLEPAVGQKFDVDEAREIVMQSLVRELAATDTRHGGRYKLVVHVLHLDTPAQIAAPDLMASSCGLWNSETDRWLTVTHRIPDGKIVITVFACYHE
ncbi:hypothetical protein AHF37_02939 [Paragonimus kellicotti]|nr:hypothetical protein AHF37_02939 [Paragonimus kellicotti]